MRSVVRQDKLSRLDRQKADEYTLFDDSNQAKYRHAFKQGDVSCGIADRDGDSNYRKAQAGACYSLCISAESHLLEGRGFGDFNDALELEMAIRTQLVEQFEITPQALRLREVVPTIVEREYTPATGDLGMTLGQRALAV